MTSCKVDGCDRLATKLGWCGMHRERVRKYGEAGQSAPLHKPDPVTRFWLKVDRRGPSQCWPWLGTMIGNGYGQFAINGVRHQAHRVAYELVIGPIPDGLVIDHLCRNRACINPSHMEPVTNEENIQRGEWAPILNAKKSTCPQGHPYDYERRGKRYCRECKLKWERAKRRAS